MSTALAIASVTHVLKDLLNNGLIDQNVSGVTGGNVIVSALPPDRIDVTPAGQSQLNLFMYRVTPNAGWKNIGFPSRNTRGERISNPPLALNLHFLLTAYGSSELHSEILLGYGMQLLHEKPVLEREAIRLSLSPATADSGGGLPDDLRALASSNLANQPELIKIVQEQINTEEISKLWSAFQAKYRPTAAYMASVVLIESDKPAKSALPVGVRGIHAFPYNQVVLDKILSRKNSGDPILENQKIVPGYQVFVKGRGLYASNMKVLIDDYSLTTLDSAKSDEIVFTLPADIPAGIKGLQVVHQVMMGSPPEPRIAAESNAMPFILCPEITSVSRSNVQGSGGEPRSADVEVQLTPGIEKGQKVILLLNEYNPGLPADQLHAYSFVLSEVPESSPPGPVHSVTFTVSGIAAATYIVRIRVDGAESPLGARDGSGYYFEPNITIS